ncbi:MAG: ABC transporter permease subunit, partial [Gammaproteobacteria bacterium]|nr:ABC transporter permease subunit [Gammaproteobacteria bacterium]
MNHNSITQQSWRQRKRAIIDNVARYTIGLGGISVIFAIVLIFFYLLWVVFPIFQSPTVELKSQFSSPFIEDVTRYQVIEESGQLVARVQSNGDLVFFSMTDGKEVHSESIDLNGANEISQVIKYDVEGKRLVLILDNHRLLFVEISYRVNFVDGKRELNPQVSFPFGDESVELEDVDQIVHIRVVREDEKLTLLIIDADNQLLMRSFEVEYGDELGEPEVSSLQEIALNVEFMVVDTFAQWLYLANKDGQLVIYNIRDLESVELVDQMIIVEDERQLKQLTMLLGGNSLMAADDKGAVRQWSLQRDKKNQYRLKDIRGFKSDAELTFLIAEMRRKGLVSVNQQGEVMLYHTTADRLLLTEKITDDKILRANLSPRANKLLLESVSGQFYNYEIKNPHPELSWKSLWSEVQYEGYDEPKYIWQSSSADNDFEPKFSLAPLAFGTLKAAFYAMLIAVPLSIMGAIYTAYFMAPKMRALVKPSIEIMEALPTVILGFLAGLWFAPVVENNLLAILSLSFVLPAGLLLFAGLWTAMPLNIRRLVPYGWQAALLMPVVIMLVWLSFMVAPLFEAVFFGGDIKHWLLDNFGIGYDQRNSLVVGIAMGLAVIPTIFSITEDAIFSVPKHLTNGSLALGATPWQTLTRVVLLTASPGIFSAVMIGLGRAVGETMIVLMATGNTPIMDMSIFQGMRTLSANIAVELPESEVASTHYRI